MEYKVTEETPTFLEEIKAAHRELLGTGKDEGGPSLIFAAIVVAIYHVYQRRSVVVTIAGSAWHEIGMDGVVFVLAVYFYLLFRAPFALRRKDALSHAEERKKLDNFIGSKEIAWFIDPELGKFSLEQFFFSGYVYNGDSVVNDAHVHMFDLKKEGSDWKGVDMELRRRGAATDLFNLLNGRKLEFDIATIIWDPRNGQSALTFIGHVEKNPIQVHPSSGLGGLTSPGIYSFTLRFSGANIKSRDCRVRIEIENQIGPIQPKVLEYDFDKYPLTNM